ncbi:hypothetical protein F383_38814 [Gossypium arboreum]|uniref:Uncharacterized protein n=1 Tax=Gossypium arboreum TaxID=29729 RepID=A0A0B0MMC1_GOSAR|nr:hypothetical protein F383_38814 [Gossypium arboreum]
MAKIPLYTGDGDVSLI